MGGSIRNGIASAYGTFTSLLTSINTFVDVGVLACAAFKTKRFYFTATTNTLSVKILGSLDGGVTYPITEVAAFDVAVGSPVSQSFTSFYTHVKVQVAPKVAATHGTLATQHGEASW